jgi:hypothetical protein
MGSYNTVLQVYAFYYQIFTQTFLVVTVNALWSTDLKEIYSLSYFLPYKTQLY